MDEMDDMDEMDKINEMDEMRRWIRWEGADGDWKWRRVMLRTHRRFRLVNSAPAASSAQQTSSRSFFAAQCSAVPP